MRKTNIYLFFALSLASNLSSAADETAEITNPQIKDFALYSSLLIQSHCDSVAAQQRPSLEDKKRRGVITEYGLQESLVALSEYCSEVLIIHLNEYMKMANLSAHDKVKKAFEKPK